MRTTFVVLWMVASALPAAAQQPTSVLDSTRTQSSYPSVSALLSSLPKVTPPPFATEQALWVGSLPLSCLDQMQPREPHRPGGARRGADYLWLPTYRLVPAYNRTRAFWGCTDWHSAVGATWATVRLLHHFPDFGLRDLAREKLNDHLADSNLKGELDFFRTSGEDFERPYGYAWLLKLQSELASWPDSQAIRWAVSTGPLAAWMADSLTAYLANLKRPVRGGSDNNTAWTVDLALDYAGAAPDDSLRRVLVRSARRFYLKERACELRSEADTADTAETGSNAWRRGRRDVVSPCLAEASLMARALPSSTFRTWLGAFLPPLESEAAAPLRETLGDRVSSGAEGARLAGLSFQRAEAMERIARALPSTDSSSAVWQRLSAMQANRGFQLLRRDTAGTDWLPARALLYLGARSRPVPEDWRALPQEHIVLHTGSTPPADSARGDTLADFPDLASFRASLSDAEPARLDADDALWLSAMPLSCEDHPHDHRDRPPYLWEVSYEPVSDFRSKRAFYGCSDWHSAVNSTWTLVKLLKLRPDLPTGPVIRRKLNDHLGEKNVEGDLAFFKTAGSFELPYGYAWLLRLQGELKSWDDADARRWAANLQPLASWMATRMVEYLDSLKRPVRVGVHPMTAMAMDNALDYAKRWDPELERAIRKSAKRFFAADSLCDTASEPGPSDFASPCLMEATVMGRLMDRSAWLEWVDQFLPPIESKAFRPLTEPLGPEFIENPKAIAARSHIIGLAFMRAKGMGELANLLPADDPRVPVLRRLAAIQVEKGFKVIGAVGYAGSHYYATFATLYLLTNER